MSAYRILAQTDKGCRERERLLHGNIPEAALTVEWLNYLAGSALGESWALGFTLKETSAIITGIIGTERFASVMVALPYKTVFLVSRYWKTVAQEVKRRANYICVSCAAYDTKEMRAHHQTYVRRGLEHLHMADLCCMCDRCHKKLHRIGRKKFPETF
jgi:hypothetical protein